MAGRPSVGADDGEAMPPPTRTGLVVRPPATDAETATCFRLAAAQFVGDVPLETAASDFRRYVADVPKVQATWARGAFRDGAYLGGYLIEERRLRIGAARLPAGAVGVVVTDPAHRRQGVATALMRDALAYARGRGLVLLLLHGMADFYTPFGYADVFDPTEHLFSRAAVLALPASPYRVRPATAADVSALLALYDRHAGSHPGSFARSAERQAFELRFAASLAPALYRTRDGLPHEPPLVAVDADDVPRGSLVLPWGPLRAFGPEVMADDWPAVLALAQHHARRLGDLAAPPDVLRWPLPPDSLAAELLADHLLVEATVLHRPWANWEAAVVDAAGLLAGMLPEWDARWRRAAVPWTCTLALSIGEAMVPLRLDRNGVRRAVGPEPGEPKASVALTARVAAPLVFGFRSVAWAAAQPGQQIPPTVRPVLDALFPPVTPWIAPTDGC